MLALLHTDNGVLYNTKDTQTYRCTHRPCTIEGTSDVEISHDQHTQIALFFIISYILLHVHNVLKVINVVSGLNRSMLNLENVYTLH